MALQTNRFPLHEPPNAAKVLDNVLFVFKRHGVLLKSLAVSSFKLLIHLCVILRPGVGIIHASLHLAQIAHEVPLAVTRHGFLQLGSGCTKQILSTQQPKRYMIAGRRA